MLKYENWPALAQFHSRVEFSPAGCGKILTKRHDCYLEKVLEIYFGFLKWDRNGKIDVEISQF